ncbi:MAG: flavodoxin [Bacillota bacterium]|nr:flavodoxin [Bacillota bacterium]
MKKTLTIILSLALVFSLAACGSTRQQGASDPTPSQSEETPDQSEPTAPGASTAAPSESEPVAEDDSEAGEEIPTGEDSAGSGILIAYFSKTGNTQTIANMLAGQTGGDLFKVETVVPYPDDYNQTVDIAREEQDNDARPELATHVDNMEQYDIIFLGYPNWWGTMPQAMFTFLEEYDFSGKTIIPFCTHGGSALGRSEGDIADLAPDATLLEGLAVSGSRVDNAQDTVAEWLNGLDME